MFYFELLKDVMLLVFTLPMLVKNVLIAKEIDSGCSKVVFIIGGLRL
jgi:hypothetical protein